MKTLSVYGDLFIEFIFDNIFDNLKPYGINKGNFKDFEERLEIRCFTGSKAISTYPIGHVSLDGHVLFRFMSDVRFNIEENKYVAAFYITERKEKED